MSLEAVLRVENILDNDENITDNIVEIAKMNILAKPELYISKTDKMFTEVMQKLGENNAGDVSFSVKALYDNDEIDGVYVSFRVTF